MNNSIPGWNFESDSCVINQKNPMWPDQELVELLWQNGHVVFQNQTQRKPIENSYDSRKVQKNDPSTLRTTETFGNSSNLSQQDDIVSWIEYPVEDPLEHQLSSNILSQLAPCEVESFKPIKQLEEGKFAKFDASSTPNATLISSQPPNMRPSSNHMPAPRFHHAPVSSSQKINDFGGSSQKAPKFPHLSAPPNGSSATANAQFREKVNANVSKGEARECSVMTVGSSHCGSNHIPQEQDVSKVSSSGVWGPTFSADHEAVRDCVQRTVPCSGKGKSSAMLEPTLTSSSGGSGSSSLGKTCSLSTGNHGLKRKATDADELEEQSEATEPNSAVGNKASQRSGSSRRSRSTEVHNLSERRRRDRINEKMKALQQLIPKSNKTDKASVLEEAIEYMKSLQLQLQIMWMGAGMAPVMFPGIQHFFPRMCMGIAAPPIQHPMQLPRMPLDQSMSASQAQNKAGMCQNPVLGAFNYQNQMQNPCLAEQYARYMMAYHHLMQSASQPMNVFGYGSQGVHPSQTMIAPSNGSGPISGAANFDDANAMSGKMGSSTF